MTTALKQSQNIVNTVTFLRCNKPTAWFLLDYVREKSSDAIFLAVFFRVKLNGLSERTTTRGPRFYRCSQSWDLSCLCYIQNCRMVLDLIHPRHLPLRT